MSRLVLLFRRRVRLLSLVLPVLAATGLCVVQLAGASVKATTFTDPTGDAGTAPDITSVQVSDDASGEITFQIATPGTSDLASDQQLIVVLDTDQNPATGNPNALGADYAFAIDPKYFYLGRWNGSDWDWSVPSSSVHTNYAGGAIMSVNRSELGGTGGFSFYVRTVQGDYGVGRFDDAPDTGTWSYTLSGGTATPPATTTATVAAPTAPTIASLVIPLNSITPRAGRVFRFTVSSIRLGSDAIVAPDSVSCKAKLGGVVVRPKANCAWQLAKSARGKRLVVSVTVRYQSVSYSQSFPLRVK